MPAIAPLLAIIFSIVGAPALADPLPEKEAQKVVLQLKWYHQFQFAGYYAALEKGFYAEEGLDLAIVEGAPSINFTDAVLSGDAQFGVNNTDLIIDRSKGKKVVVLAVIFQHSPLLLIARADRSIAVPNDLVGKSVMVSVDAEAEIYSMFRNESIPLDAIRFVPHSWNLDDLVDGKVDAVSAYSTNEQILLELRGVDATVVRPLIYGIDFYGDCLFTSEAELKAHPERVAAFLRSSMKGWEYAMDHREEIADLILERYSRRKTKSELLLEADAMAELILPKLVPLGFMNPGRWRHVGDTYVQLGALPKDYTLDGFLYESGAPSVDAGLVRILSLLAGGLSLAAFAYILVLRTFNLRLSREVRSRTERLSELNRALEGELALGDIREKRIAASLSEKEVLLREIHHRVKNNLQIIVSIINLQSDGEEEGFLRELKLRVMGIALVHEYLYSGGDLSRVDMGNYLPRLVSEIVRSYLLPGTSVGPSVTVGEVSLAIDQAVPLGLIVNELVSNSMKYAFSGRPEGRLEVDLSSIEGRCVLAVRDDGPGPAGEAGDAESAGLGMRLVEALASQLSGDLRTETDGGYRVIVDFPVT